MANKYSVKVDADISSYNEQMDSAADSTKKFQDAAEDANKSVKDLGKKGSKSVKDLISEMQNIEKGGRSVSNYKKKLSGLTRDIQDLTVNYRNLSKEMQNSDIGRETLIKINELQKEAAAYKDAVGDAQQAIRQLSSDTFAFDAAAAGIDLMSSALQTYISLGFSSADTTEKLSQVLGKLKTAENAAAFAIKALNELNKDTGHIMQLIGNIQSAAAVKAAKLAQATGKATLAQKAFNLVAKANPYVLLATAIAALVIGIGSYIAITKKSTSAADEAARATKRFTKALEEGKTEANSTIAKFMTLQAQWKSLRTEGEKTEWIKDNQTQFKELGLNINSVNDAEKAFVRYSTNIIKAMALRSQAAKLAAEAQKEYEKALNDADKQQRKAENAGNDFSGLTRKDIKKYGLQEDVDYVLKSEVMSGGGEDYVRKWFELTPAGKDKLKQAGADIYQSVMDGADERVKPAIEKMNDLISQAEALESPLGPIVDDASKVDDAIKAAEGSLTAANQKLSEMKTKFEAMSATDPGFDKMKQDVIDQEKLVERLKKKYETIKTGSAQQTQNLSRLSQLKEELSTLHKIDSEVVEGTAEWDKHYKKIAEIEKEIKDLEDSIEAYKKRINSEPLELVPVISKIEMPKYVDVPEIKPNLKPLSNEELRKFYDDIQSKASNIQKDFDLGLISPKAAQIMIDNLNTELRKKGIKAEVGIDFHVDEQDLRTGLQKAVAGLDSFSGVADGIVGSFNDIYESLKGLGDKIAEANNGWERFFAIFQSGMTIINSFATILETLNTVIGIANVIKDAHTAATERDTTATRKNTQEKLKNAGATAAEAIASGTKSAADIPVVGWALAIGAAAALVAALLSAMKSVKNFASGGIVGGSSFHGDKILAGINSGEMILNPQQQANLFKMLDSGKSDSSNSGNVEFKIRGTELVGVLNNTNRKNSKI